MCASARACTLQSWCTDKTIREIEPQGERRSGLCRAARDEGEKRRGRTAGRWGVEEGGARERSVPIGSFIIIPAESQVIPDWRLLLASW